MLLAASATAVFRASTTFWASSGGTMPLEQLIDLEFQALADGLPEHCDVRHVGASPGERPPQTPPHGNVADRKDNH
jgi:hypothetical protein